MGGQFHLQPGDSGAGSALGGYQLPVGRVRRSAAGHRLCDDPGVETAPGTGDEAHRGVAVCRRCQGSVIHQPGVQAFPLLKSPDELDKVEQFPIEPGLASFGSAHNQGTCRMGSSRDNSVVDQNLRLHTGDNIYVMDASVMPSSAPTHVMQPIMVVADRAIHRMPSHAGRLNRRAPGRQRVPDPALAPAPPCRRIKARPVTCPDFLR
jgi:choline dehydrogenase-like flavoprotein